MPTGKSYAHQIINTGDQSLKFLCFSTGGDLDIVTYPDSGKFGVSGFASSEMPARALELRSLFDHEQAHADYWKGEGPLKP